MVDKQSRFVWDDFPRVWIHAQELAVKKHPSYKAAKSGNPDAAFQLVSDFISKEVITQLRDFFQYRNPIPASVHAIEGTGVNAIPEVLADILAEHLGWRTDSGIVQTNIVSHTGRTAFHGYPVRLSLTVRWLHVSTTSWWMISLVRAERLQTCVPILLGAADGLSEPLS